MALRKNSGPFAQAGHPAFSAQPRKAIASGIKYDAGRHRGKSRAGTHGIPRPHLQEKIRVDAGQISRRLPRDRRGGQAAVEIGLTKKVRSFPRKSIVSNPFPSDYSW